MTDPEFDEPIVEVTMLLADAAQVADGKLYVLGGGLQAIGPKPQATALVLLIHVPWDRTNLRHDWQLELLDEDGVPVLHQDRPVIVGGQFEAGRPPGAAPGTSLPVPLAINFTALPVTAGRSYSWRLAVNGTSEPQWRTVFRVDPAPVVEA
jgi:hypothetical protein